MDVTNRSSPPTPNGRFTPASVEAASYIYEDCRARGQGPSEAMSRAVGRLIERAASSAEAARYHHITKDAIEWDEGDTKKWMICDQFYSGPTLGEAIDAAMKGDAS